MRLLSTAMALLLLTTLLCSTARCALSGEIVLWGSDTERPATNAAAYAPTSAAIQSDAAVYFEIRCPAAGYTVAQRERIILIRLAEALSQQQAPVVAIDEIRGRPTLYLNKVRLVTVYPEDVAAAKACSARCLAERWAEGLRAGLAKTAPLGVLGGPPVYRVAIGGKLLFRLIYPDGYENVRRRGEEVDRRLAKLMQELTPGALATVPVADGVMVTVHGKPLVTACPGDILPGEYESTQELAAAWVKNLLGLLPTVGAPSETPAGACCTNPQ